MREIIEFLIVAGRLKRTPRTGWVKAGIDKAESVADHSYRTALIAMVLSDLKGQNTEKVTRMALLHDLAEAETGDLTPEQKTLLGSTYHEDEEEAMKQILSKLPQRIAEGYHSIWKEYTSAGSPEAETVVEADAAEMLLQALEYEERGIPPYKLDGFWLSELRGRQPSELIRELEKRRRDRADLKSS